MVPNLICCVRKFSTNCVGFPLRRTKDDGNKDTKYKVVPILHPNPQMENVEGQKNCKLLC